MRQWLLLVLGCLACNPHVFSPPAGNYPLEQAGTVGAGRNSLGADIGAAGTLGGPNFTSVRMIYRRGIGDQLELSAAPSVIRVRERAPGDSRAGIYALRMALKYKPVEGVGTSLGIGVGGSAAGAFLSPDLVVSFSYDDLPVVPFATVRGFLSAPIAPKHVHFTILDDSSGEDEYRRYSLAPRFTYGVQLGAGLRFNLYGDQARVRPSLPCGLALTLIYDARSEDGYAGGGCGLELSF